MKIKNWLKMKIKHKKKIYKIKFFSIMSPTYYKYNIYRTP